MQKEYLREPNDKDITLLLALGDSRGFPGNVDFDHMGGPISLPQQYATEFEFFFSKCTEGFIVEKGIHNFSVI